MASDTQRSNFVLIERNGWSERELCEADSLEEMLDTLTDKTGSRRDTDGRS